MKLTTTNRVPWNKGKRGVQINPRKGKKCPEISLRQMGENNPMFGRTEDKNPNWKGGISKTINNCPDCGKKLHHYLSKYCFKCSFKHRKNNVPSGENSPLWKGGLPKCLNCGKEIDYQAKYCLSCSRLGERNSNWHGGVSFENYPVAFNSVLKREIKKRDGYKCVICDWVPSLESNQRLVVHHIDYDKNNLNTKNLITLCSTCHSKTNRNRDYWLNFFEEL
jgi:hypothetical protein